jgi:23S rRNA (guanosine2251-2'-O)-methyltransferase
LNKKREGLFGINPLLESLKAGSREFDKIYIAKGAHGKGIDEAVRICRQQNIPVHFEGREALDRISGTTKHQGIYGIVAAKGYSSVEEILDIAENRKEDPFILLLDSVEDPRNLGAIIRTADGAGVHGIIIPKHRASGLSSTVAKTSAGAIEHVQISRETNLLNTINFLRDRGLWIYGLDMDGEREYTNVSYDIPLGIVIGGEGRGIRESIRKACDVRVRIPLFGHINSLNVSVASGIILFEIAKHRVKGSKTADKTQY